MLNHYYPESDDHPERGRCDGCEEFGPYEDLIRHEDGNLYCPNCDYQTEEEKLWDRADSLRAELENR